jgi:hypothetical protein
LRFIRAHIHDGRGAAAGVGDAGDVHKARLVVQVGSDA